MPDQIPPHKSPRLIDSRHPSIREEMFQWPKWRKCFFGGTNFIHEYLERFSNETDPDFSKRKNMTFPTLQGKSAITEIQTSIFQHMADISRIGGSSNYQNAVMGFEDGVDLRGSSMNSFMGHNVLTELLVMGRVGVYVDMPSIHTTQREMPTLADVQHMRPYLYAYQVEDILSWTLSLPEEESEFKALLLQDTVVDYDEQSFLPKLTIKRFRYLWVDDLTGFVNMQFYNLDGKAVDARGNLTTKVIQLGLRRIPFVLLDLNGGLMKDVCDHQITLLNLASSSVFYAHKANYPYYIEQQDMRTTGAHLTPNANPDGSASVGQQRSHLKEIEVGINQGRAYDITADPPAFIHPSPAPLLAGLQFQDSIKEDIRQQVGLAIKNIGSRASAESKTMDNQGLESGLSFIGVLLSIAETKLAKIWASYEDKRTDKQNIAVIKYPNRYSLKTDKQRIEEASDLIDVVQQVPSNLARKLLWKTIINKLLAGKVSVEEIQKIEAEVVEASYTTSDPDLILRSLEKGVLGLNTAAKALGFDEKEPAKALRDQASRIAIIQASQTKQDTTVAGDNAARGIDDLDPDPTKANREKEDSRNPDLSPDRNIGVRGKGKRNKGSR